VSQYCTVAEVGTIGVNPEAFTDATPEQRRQEVKSASDLMDSYLANRYTLPLTAWPDVLRKCCAVLAACNLIDARGRDPDADSIVDITRKFWIEWLKGVSTSAVTPPGVTDSTPGATPGSSAALGARVQSSSSRGYSIRGTGDQRGPFQTD
jgi:phage gp36-like protein